MLKKPSPREIKSTLKKLRKMYKTSTNPAERRIAQAMECAIVWATQKTEGWCPLDEDAQLMARFATREIRGQIAKEITQ